MDAQFKITSYPRFKGKANKKIVYLSLSLLSSGLQTAGGVSDVGEFGEELRSRVLLDRE